MIVEGEQLTSGVVVVGNSSGGSIGDSPIALLDGEVDGFPEINKGVNGGTSLRFPGTVCVGKSSRSFATPGQLLRNSSAASGSLVKTFAQTLLEGRSKVESGKPVKPPAFRDGEPAAYFTTEDIADSCEPLTHAIIAKCSYGRPTIIEVKSHIVQTLHLEGIPIISRLDPRHLLIRLNSEEDFLKLLLQQNIIIKGFLFRFFKWQIDFDFKADPPVIPAWISFPGLPANFYREDMLKTIAGNIGPVLRIHDNTLAMANTAEATICVELNLAKVRRDRVWIGIGGNGYWQKVDYSRVPTLCSFCHKIGHVEVNCRKKMNKIVPRKNDLGIAGQKQGKQEFRPKKVYIDNVVLNENKFEILNSLGDEMTNESDLLMDPLADAVISNPAEVDTSSLSSQSNEKSVTHDSGFLPSIQEESVSEGPAEQLFSSAEGLGNISSPEEAKSVLKRRNVGAISSISLAENSKMLCNVGNIPKNHPKAAPPSMFPGDLLSDVRLTRAKAKVMAGEHVIVDSND